MAAARASMIGIGTAGVGAGKGLTAASTGLSGLAKAGIAAGGVLAVGLALKSVAGAAIDFESSFAGIKKTVDATEAQFGTMERQLRALSKEIPINVNELNRIAEAAGQLGVQKSNIVSFTEVMAKLGVATNLSATEAATSLARFANVMGTSQKDFDRLGSVIVGLGNTFETTESEILTFGQRLAAAGAIAGFTEGDVFGLAASLSSVGIQAEAGGSAFSRVILDMNSAVAGMTEDLTTFAGVAGTTAGEFAKQWNDDAAGALNSFIEGLARMRASGVNIIPVLEDLGLNNIRVRNAILSAVLASDKFAEGTASGNRLFEENNALNIEAAKRFETTASKMTLATNSMNDLKLSMGQALLPAIQETVGWLGQLAGQLDQVFVAMSQSRRIGIISDDIREFSGQIQGTKSQLSFLERELKNAQERFEELDGPMRGAVRNLDLLTPAGFKMRAEFKQLKSEIPALEQVIEELNLKLHDQREATEAADAAVVTFGPHLEDLAKGQAKFAEATSEQMKIARQAWGEYKFEVSGVGKKLQELGSDVTPVLKALADAHDTNLGDIITQLEKAGIATSDLQGVVEHFGEVGTQAVLGIQMFSDALADVGFNRAQEELSKLFKRVIDSADILEDFSGGLITSAEATALLNNRLKEGAVALELLNEPLREQARLQLEAELKVVSATEALEKYRFKTSDVGKALKDLGLLTTKVWDETAGKWRETTERIKDRTTALLEIVAKKMGHSTEVMGALIASVGININDTDRIAKVFGLTIEDLEPVGVKAFQNIAGEVQNLVAGISQANVVLDKFGNIAANIATISNQKGERDRELGRLGEFNSKISIKRDAIDHIGNQLGNVKLGETATLNSGEIIPLGEFFRQRIAELKAQIAKLFENKDLFLAGASLNSILQGLAHGGIVQKAGNYLVGEGGKPEVLSLPTGAAVLPMKRIQDMLANMIASMGSSQLSPMMLSPARGSTAANSQLSLPDPQSLNLPRGAQVTPLGRGAGGGDVHIHYNQNGPVYGFFELRREVVKIIRDAISAGGLRGIIPGFKR